VGGFFLGGKGEKTNNINMKYYLFNNETRNSIKKIE
jgi:hypothetical protein